MTTLERQTYTKCLRIESLALRWLLKSHYGLSLEEFREILESRGISFTEFVMTNKNILMSAKWLLEELEDEEN